MPIIQVRYATPNSAEEPTRAAIVAAVMKPTVDILGKKPTVTAVVADRIDPEAWFIAGRSLADWNKASVFVEIRVTDGTNTKAEKEAFIADVFDRMARLLGPLHEESYVHVHDVRAEAYGYGGRTQEYRFIADRIEQAERETASLDAFRKFGIR